MMRSLPGHIPMARVLLARPATRSPTPKPLHLDIEWAREMEACWLLSLCPWAPFTPLPHSLPLTHIYSFFFFYIKKLKKEKKKPRADKI